MPFRSTSARRNCKLLRLSACPLGVLFLLSFITAHAIGEPVMILDPHFYHTPISLPIAGSSRTVIGFYDEAKDGTVTPISAASLAEHPLPELKRLALAHARGLLQHVTPKISRDKNGVAIDIRIESTDPSLSSLVLLPGFADQFVDILGKNCVISIPNRQVIFLFPRIGGDIEQLSYALRSFYHNNAWPVSTELFEWRNGALFATRDLESAQ
ncbi:MAG TPA: hypothetical protein VE242_12670 [Chthoniobacterales bacterium]|nr:hypothetical protein [Chthoniobacterales bacterium]